MREKLYGNESNRKEHSGSAPRKGAKQEELAAAVGVSPQAVSKWEVGGSPDIELLPAIADFFGVSIDKLFGRDLAAADIGMEIRKSLRGELDNAKDSSAYFNKVMEYCWTLQIGAFATDEHGSIDDAGAQLGGDVRLHSQIIPSRGGLASIGIRADHRYYIVMPEPSDGWKFGGTDAYAKFFAFLGEPDALRTLMLLYSRAMTGFTHVWLEKNANVSHERAEAIIARLIEYRLLLVTEIELDDERKTVYNFNANAMFVPLLTMAEDIIARPTNFYFNSSWRQTPLIAAINN
ncbi:MAG: helix-turn-helix transcriptional regulator [Oscillospiraceae bacterium]|jgi:transcriptional regulator with XRE-family HTH domain|nr:helix-turn-helix transcriptional regulator [Oscillospiraceae bacterium]